MEGTKPTKVQNHCYVSHTLNVQQAARVGGGTQEVGNAQEAHTLAAAAVS